VLSSSDPANPYGAAIPWPKTDEARLQRAAGSHVVLVDGTLAAYVAGNGRDVVPLLPREEPVRTAVARAAARALSRWGGATSRPALGWVAGAGSSLAEGPLAPFLVEVGFVRSGPGFRLVNAAAGSDGV
jgi:ATP-dependent Lhr-like helicase